MKIILSILFSSLIALPVICTADQIDSLRVNENDIETGKSQKKILAAEVLVSRAKRKALIQIKSLIKKYRGTSTEPGLIYRLAELYMGRAKSARFVEQIANEQGVLSFLPSEIKSLKEKELVQRAIQNYSKIEKRFENYPELDQVIFNMAFAHLQVGNDELAEKVFIRLIKKKPRSRLVPDAFLAIGEINFKKLKFKRALVFYSRVKKYKTAKVYPYGLYKGAWCYYNLKGYEQAIANLENVIAFGSSIEKNGLDQRMDIRNEALVDMALFYSTVRKGIDAVNYFVNLAGSKDPVPPLRRLAKIYERYGKNIKQQAVLLGLVEKFSGHKEEPYFYKELTKNYDRQTRHQKSAKALQLFNKSCLSTMKKDTTLGESYCQEDVDKVSKNLAIKWLKLYEKQEKNPPILAEVIETAFRVHLYKKEPSDRNSEMRFYFAEYIFGLNRFIEASQEYDKVADSTKDIERKHKARYAAIFSFDKNFNSVYKKSEDELRFKELSNKYMKNFPKGKEYLNIAFKLALYNYTKKSYDEAAPLLLSLGQRFNSLEKGRKSQDLYLDVLNSKKEYEKIQKYAKLWQVKEEDPLRVKSLQKLFEQSFFSEVEILEKNKNYKQALKRYEDFINQNPQSEFVDEARWNKISMHFKLKEYDKTAESYVSFYNLHPKHKNVVSGLVKAVEIYEMMAEPERAISVTKNLEKVDIKNASKWFYLGSSYLMSSGSYELAAKNFHTIMFRPSIFKNTAIESFFSMDSRLDSSSWYQTMLTNLLRSPNNDLAQRALNSKIGYLERRGSKKDLFDFVYKEIRITKLNKSQKGPLYYYRGKKKSEEFFNTKIRSKSMNTIVAGIQEKTKILDYAQNLFQKGLSSDDQKYVIKSLIGLSKLYDSYVSNLKNLRAPAAFGPDEAEALKQELENIIMPFEEKSADVLNQATQVAKSANFRDGTMGEVKGLFDIVNLDEKTVHNIKARLPGSVGPRGI